MRDLERFTSTPEISSISQKLPPPSLQSLLVVGTGGGGTGATALACWAAADASQREEANYVRMISSLDLLVDGGGGSEDARAACLIDKFTEAREMPNSILVLDDVDQICAGSGQNGYSSIMLSTLRALLRTPSMTTKTAKAGGHSESNVSKLKDGRQRPNTFRVLAATSRSDAACVILHELFDETLVVPLLSDAASVTKLLDTGIEKSGLAVVNANISIMADRMVQKLGSVGCKTALRIVERTVAMAGSGNDDERVEQAQLTAFDHILEDLAGDQAAAERACEVIY